MSVNLHTARDGLTGALANDVLMDQTSTGNNTNFNTYDFLPEHGWKLLLSTPRHLPLHRPSSSDSSIEFQQDNLSVQ